MSSIRGRIRSSKSPDPDRIHAKNKIKKVGTGAYEGKISVAAEMEKMRQRRIDRKKRIEDEKRNKYEMLHNPNYNPNHDLDYEYMISEKKKIIEAVSPKPHTTSDKSKIFVCVRKRPIFQKEIQNGEIDCISAINPKVCVYDCKMKIDGITKYIDCNEFYFDNVFSEFEDTELLYECSINPTINLLQRGGVVTCFAYGQTGSGKTYTMKGIQNSAIDSLFEAFPKNKYRFFVSFFEIYSGVLYDLLNDRNKVRALEDKNQKVQIFGLTEKEVSSPKEMRDVVEYANTMRTTHNTVTNETSSRSHAICNFVIKERNKEEDAYAKLTLVDLAGSERATETQSNNKSRLAEGAEINKSLLALKECIRALDARKAGIEQHVPFRTSKLTLVLRDSFIAKSNISKIIMISCISPGQSSANHTINTLRYSDRLKEKTSQMKNNRNNNDLYSLGNNNAHTQQNEKLYSDQRERYHGSFLQKGDEDQMLNNLLSGDIEEEDHLQKLNLNPTPISKVVQKHKYVSGHNQNKGPRVPVPTRKCQTSQSSRPKKNSSNLSEIDYLQKASEFTVNDSQSICESEKIYSDEANYINEDHQEVIPDLLEEQDCLISSHMGVMKEEAKLLGEEGNLISDIKGVTRDNYPMEEYALKLEGIICKKLEYYHELKRKIKNYKSLSVSATASTAMA